MLVDRRMSKPWGVQAAVRAKVKSSKAVGLVGPIGT